MKKWKEVLLATSAGVILWQPLPSYAETMRSGLDKVLQGAGVEERNRVHSALESQVGSVIDSPLHDTVDFSNFPTAQLNVNKISNPAVLVLSPGLVNYVFRGKPDSFQGSFRSYEFFLGKGVQKASHIIFPQVFQSIRSAISLNEARTSELAVVPEITDFKFRWGGAFIPVMSVDLEVKVSVFGNGKKIFEQNYLEHDIKEGAGSLFPNEDQEHKAISRALIGALKRSGFDIASSREVAAFKHRPIQKVQVAGHEKVDMDAILFLAGSWQQYARNKNRLTLLEKHVATRLLRLQDAWEKKDTVKQQEQIDALIAHSKTLEPVSRTELLQELKYQKGYTDIQIAQLNRAEDNYYNFAGNSTGTVLDYAGLGIDLAKVGVLAAGCIMSSGTTCLALATTMGEFDMAGTVAEGIGAASEEYFHKSGDVMTSLFAGSKSALIDVGAGKIAGSMAEITMGRLAHHGSRKMAEKGIKDLAPDRLIRMRDEIYINSMELLQRAPEAGTSSLLKDGTKRLTAKTEELLFGEKIENKSLTNSTKNWDKLQSLEVESLREL